MVKLAVLIVLGLVAYGLIKRNISSGKKERAAQRKQSAAYNQRAPMPHTAGGGEVEVEEPRAEEETVYDSICMSYIPLETAIGAKVGKTTHYFCSEFCRRTYVNTYVNAPY